MKKQIAVFSDIDGTLIDSHYSLNGSQEFVGKLLSLGVHVVLCSSKTRVEVEFYRSKLGITEPFISENGAAIFIPKNYFKSTVPFSKQDRQYFIVELGIPYTLIRQKLALIKQKSGLSINGFGDMTVEEVAKDTGLSLKLAGLAKQREYSEPFRYQGFDEKKLLGYFEKEGLNCIKGKKYYHLSGQHDKGKAVLLLKDLYVKEFGELESYGVGNDVNDLPMLDVVDNPYFIDENERLGKVWSLIAQKVTKELDEQ